MLPRRELAGNCDEHNSWCGFWSPWPMICVVRPRQRSVTYSFAGYSLLTAPPILGPYGSQESLLRHYWCLEAREKRPKTSPRASEPYVCNSDAVVIQPENCYASFVSLWSSYSCIVSINAAALAALIESSAFLWMKW